MRVLCDWGAPRGAHLCPAKTVAMAPAPGSHSRTSVSWQPAATRQCAAATGDMATELTLLGSSKELTTSTLEGRRGAVCVSVEWMTGSAESGVWYTVHSYVAHGRASAPLLCLHHHHRGTPHGRERVAYVLVLTSWYPTS